MSDAALRWSFWIWIGRESHEWFAQRVSEAGSQGSSTGTFDKTSTGSDGCASQQIEPDVRLCGSAAQFDDVQADTTVTDVPVEVNDLSGGLQEFDCPEDLVEVECTSGVGCSVDLLEPEYTAVLLDEDIDELVELGATGTGEDVSVCLDVLEERTADPAEIGVQAELKSSAVGVDHQIKALRNEADIRQRVVSERVFLGHRNWLWSGLKNLGNSCYMNAVMQCIAVVEDVAVDEGTPAHPFIQEYVKLVDRLQRRTAKTIVPREFKLALGHVNGQFRGRAPEDAHELLTTIMVQLEVCATPGPSLEHRSRANLISELTCASCLCVSSSEHNVNCLSVPIVDKPKVTVMDGLNRYFAAEHMDAGEAWTCSACGAKSGGTKKLKLERFPDLLVVHLNRFTFKNGLVEKNEAAVGIPTNLDVHGKGYRLVAVVRHSGSRRSGHYVADISTESGWMEVDDAGVRRKTMADFYHSPYVYIMFYEALSVPDTSLTRLGPAISLNESREGAETRYGSS